MRKLSKKLILATIVFLIIIAIMVVILLYFYNEGLTQNSNNYNITFNEINYTSINNTIFYNSKLNLSEETKEHFDIISKEFSNQYQNKQISFLEKLGEINDSGNIYSIYSFIQISNNIIIDNDALNIYFNETDRKIDYILSASEYDLNRIE